MRESENSYAERKQKSTEALSEPIEVEETTLKIGTAVTGLFVEIDKAEVVKLKSTNEVDPNLRVQLSCIPAPTLKKLLTSVATTIKDNAARIAEENEQIKKDHKDRMFAEYENDRRLLLMEKRMDALMKAQKRAKFTAHRQYREVSEMKGNNAKALATELSEQRQFGGSAGAEDSWRHHNHHHNYMRSPAIQSALGSIRNDSTVPASVKAFVEALTSCPSRRNDHSDAEVDHSEWTVASSDDDNDGDWTEFKEVHYRLEKIEERLEKIKVLPRWCKTLEKALQAVEERVGILDDKFAHFEREQRLQMRHFGTFRREFECHETANRDDFKAVREEAVDLRDQIDSIRRDLHDTVPRHDMLKKAEVGDLSDTRHDLSISLCDLEDRIEELKTSHTASMEILQNDMHGRASSIEMQQSSILKEITKLAPCGWCTSCGFSKAPPQYNTHVPHACMPDTAKRVLQPRSLVPKRPSTGHGIDVTRPDKNAVDIDLNLPQVDSNQVDVGESGQGEASMTSTGEKLALSLRVGTTLVSPSPVMSPTPRSRSVADSAIQKENREQKRMNPAAEFTWRVSGGIAIPPKFESGPPRDHHRPRSDQDSKYRGNNKTRQAEAWTGKLNRSWQTGQWTAASRSSKSAK